jgi:hypothetical protein
MALGMLAVVVVAGLAVVALNNAPETSTVTQTACIRAGQADDCVRFPVVSGANLLDEVLTLPADFTGDYVFVTVPFDREQQVVADTWLPLARELADQYDGLTFYNVPVFPDLAAPVRLFARTGLRAVIGDEALQAATITVFLENRDDFLTAMDVPDVERIQVFLLDGDGEVYWRGVGTFDDTQANEVRARLEALVS